MAILHVFVDAEGSLESFVKELEQILEVEFQPMPAKVPTYIGMNNNTLGWVGVRYNTLVTEDIPGRNYSDYAFRLFPGTNQEAQYIQAMDDTYTWLYEKLKATNKFPLLVSHDVYGILDRFNPE
jgi:hypothetical protein